MNVRSAAARVLACASLLVAAPLTTATSQAPQAREGICHLVQVRIDDGASLDALLRLDLDLAACQVLEFPARIVDVIAHGERDLERLRQSGLPFQIAISDLQAYHARELARFGPFLEDALNPPLGQGAMGGHYTLAQMEAILDGFARDFPGLCSPKASIGRSIEGRDIWVVKISDNVGTAENEARVFFDALHHAREPVSMAATLAFMDWVLTNYGTDPDATLLVDEREMYFVPCVNPDGYEYNRTTNPGGGGMWRKNRRNNGNGTFGVDLNRNYQTGWTAPYGGSSTNPSSETYRGTAPFSEPETQAIESFMTGMGFSESCSTHTYTDVLLHPWGYQNGGPSNRADYDAIGPGLVDENGVAYGPVSTLLYVVAGGALDHHHAAHGIVAWSPELGRQSEGGFWPNPPTQVAIVGRHLTMFRDMALTAGALIELGDATVTEEPGGNGNGAVGPGETGAVAVRVDNAGLQPSTTSVQVQIASLTSGVGVLSGQATVTAPGRLGSTTTAPGALRIGVSSGFQGVVATLRVTVTGGGRTTTRDIDFRTVPVRVLVTDDMERDRGFTRDPSGTATTGQWERAAPQQTTYNGAVFQPGSDHSPAGTLCQVTDARAGSSVGSYDVDGGFTDLLSPVIDLSHLAYAELVFWRWYAESVGNDAFEIAVRSAPGGAWTNLLVDSTSTSGWEQEVLELPGPLTATMQLRFRAQDQNASLVEACIDDLEIRGVGPDAGVVVLSSGVIGSSARVGLSGTPNALVTALAGPFLGTPTQIPGIGGTLFLDPVLIVAIGTRTLDGEGAAGLDVAIPNDPNLRNASLHWQALQASGAGWTLGNVQSTTFR